MRRWAVVLSAVTVSLGAATAVTGTTANADNGNDPYTVSDGHAQAGPAGGMVPARDANGNAHGKPGGGGSSPNMSYHGGPIQTATTVEAIYWGPSWGTNPGDKITGLDSFYLGLTGTSGYGNTNSEYTNGSGVNVNPVSTYANHAIDTSALTFSGSPSTGTIANEVVKVIGASNIVPGGYYPVYVDAPRGNAGYCAWHSAATLTSTRVEFQFGFFFKLDGDPGCDPQAPAIGSDSQGLLALANVSGHEYSEMVTDPQLNAWYDQQGAENADKCAWHFNGTETLSNGSQWYIQGNWSNAAYTANSGYYNRGCITSG